MDLPAKLTPIDFALANQHYQRFQQKITCPLEHLLAIQNRQILPSISTMAVSYND
jgi:hypothetical protein